WPKQASAFPTVDRPTPVVRTEGTSHRLVLLSLPHPLSHHRVKALPFRFPSRASLRLAPTKRPHCPTVDRPAPVVRTEGTSHRLVLLSLAHPLSHRGKALPFRFPSRASLRLAPNKR